MLDHAELLEENGGPITTTLFPNSDTVSLSARLERYVDNAYEDSRVSGLEEGDVRDAGAKALALYTAFMDVWRRMSAEPMTVNVAEKGSHGYSATQLANIKAQADAYLADLSALQPAGEAIAPGGATRAVPVRFTW